MATVGNWVSIRNRNATGFILEANYSDVVVYVFQDGKDKGKQRFAHHQLIELPNAIMPEEEEELRWLHINMALDTGDKEWFAELGGSMEESK